MGVLDGKGEALMNPCAAFCTIVIKPSRLQPGELLLVKHGQVEGREEQYKDVRVCCFIAYTPDHPIQSPLAQQVMPMGVYVVT